MHIKFCDKQYSSSTRMKVFIVILVFVTISLLLISNSTNLKNNLLRSSRFSCSVCSMLFPALETKDKYIGIEEGEREREAEKKMERESEVKASKFKRICVYCGSSQGKKDIYREAAIELGKVMVSKNIDLVYGGGSVGLMGLVSHAVHDGGRHVLGVIPKTLMARELTGKTVGEVKVVADMHQRKSEMAKLSDAFIALPGGYGTFEEILEVITWAQLGIHDKPVGLLNVDGFYDSLLSFIDKGIEDGFISPVDRHIIVSAPTAKDLIEKLEEYVPRDNGIASRLKWEKDQQAQSKKCNSSS